MDKISSEDNREHEAKAPVEEDVVDECCRLTKDDDVTTAQPQTGEYKKIMEMLKEAEAEADPEYEENKRRMEYMLKYNPRNAESDLNLVDYCCAFFQCFAMCIEG